MIGKLSTQQRRRFSVIPAKCPVLQDRIVSIAKFMEVLSSTLTGDASFWYRGVPDAKYDLTPSALRYSATASRLAALDLPKEFKRVARLKISDVPAQDAKLEWLQIAQHFGLPTRLLDWTESATFALFFSCSQHHDRDAVVYVFNPIDLNRRYDPAWSRILDYDQDQEIIDKIIDLQPVERPNAKPPVAINPVWNSERLLIQRGCFTLHGARFALRPADASSLMAVPILAEDKAALLGELERIGVDEMTIFPELEHACSHLKRKLR